VHWRYTECRLSVFPKKCHVATAIVCLSRPEVVDFLVTPIVRVYMLLFTRGSSSLLLVVPLSPPARTQYAPGEPVHPQLPRGNRRRQGQARGARRRLGSNSGSSNNGRAFREEDACAIEECHRSSSTPCLLLLARVRCFRGSWQPPLLLPKLERMYSEDGLEIQPACLLYRVVPPHRARGVKGSWAGRESLLRRL